MLDRCCVARGRWRSTASRAAVMGLLALSNLPVVAAQTSAIGILVGVLLFVFSVPVIAKILHILMKKFREAKKKLAVFDEEDSEDEDG